VGTDSKGEYFQFYDSSTNYWTVGRIPYADFKELYFKRWAIETYYNRFKNIIGVEHFSGTSCQSILQEFYCALYMSNMQAILTMDAQQQARKKYEHRLINTG